jgi:hypothetical protein
MYKKNSMLKTLFGLVSNTHTGSVVCVCMCVCVCVCLLGGGGEPCVAKVYEVRV